MKVRDVLKRLNREGWYQVRVTGDHRQFNHDEKAGIVTVPGKPGEELTPGTLASIRRQAGWKD